MTHREDFLREIKATRRIVWPSSGLFHIVIENEQLDTITMTFSISFYTC